jgi:tRNA(Ile)-lysidine synthase
VRLTVSPANAAAFASAMAALGPFEPRPLIAVGVSGGPDSLALTLLMNDWAKSHGGAVLALTVDHGLRPEAAAEARQVGSWLAARGIDHHILTWTGDKPGAGIQAAARAARYRLLADACAARGILHLAVAHHADDQAETVLFRRERGSGPDGLAGMTASRSLGAVRLIRPLLAWPKDRLIATCAEFGQPYVEDPSNRSPDYARPVLRQRLAGDPDLRAALLKTALKAGETRRQLGKTVASTLGRAVTIGPGGFALIDRAELLKAPPKPRHSALSAILRTVGGGAFAPDEAAVARLDEILQNQSFRGANLGGCLVRPWRGALLVCRETARAAPPERLVAHAWQRWDGRFEVFAQDIDKISELTVGALGARGWATVPRRSKSAFSAVAGAGLPAIRNGEGVVSIPSIGWNETGSPRVRCRLSPLWPLASETFTVVSAGTDIMSDRGERSRRN